MIKCQISWPLQYVASHFECKYEILWYHKMKFAKEFKHETNVLLGNVGFKMGGYT